MKISKVTARLLEAAPQVGVTFGIGAFNKYSMVLVEVTNEDGITGYGEAIARRGGKMTATAVEHLLAETLIGENTENIEGLWVRMVDQLRRWGHTGGVVLEAISGVDTALWDLLGKEKGEPVWRLLTGSGRTQVPVYASSVYIDEREKMVREAVEQAERGFNRIKIKIGRSPEAGGEREDIAVLRAIRDAVGQDIVLVTDANGAYDTATAIKVARAMEDIDVRWFEEPLPPDDLAGYRRLHQMTTTPLARGETDFGMWTLGNVITDRLVDVVQPDIARCGGITGARHVWTHAYFANLAFAPHTGFSGGLSQLAALHVAAASMGLLALEYMFIDNPAREIFVGGYPRPINGFLAVPEGPGLGLELDHDLIDKYIVR